jgi:hypothetical protein
MSIGGFRLYRQAQYMRKKASRWLRQILHHQNGAPRLRRVPGGRQGVGAARSPLRRRSCDPHRPRAVRACSREHGRSVGRGAHRPTIEPRKNSNPDADVVHRTEGKTDGARDRECPDDPAWSETPACADALLYGNREISCSADGQFVPQCPHRADDCFAIALRR